MPNLYSPSCTAIHIVSGTLLSLIVLTSPVIVLAHGDDGDAFGGGNEAASNTNSVDVNPETAQRLGIKVEPVKRQPLAIGIQTTGQIETLPNQQAEVTTPITESKVVELLVQPGAKVTKGEPVAVLTSPELATLRVDSMQNLAQGQADLLQGQADLKLAQQNYARYQQIAKADITQAQSQVAYAQEKYNKDQQLADAGALPHRTALESQTQLQQAKAELTKANNQRDVISAQNQLKRAQAAVNVAKSRINLSNTTYKTRLQQLGTLPNNKGLVTVTAPISGKIADREVTIGQSFKDAGGKLMTIVNDTQVFANANIYERDLTKVRRGQKVNVKVAAVHNHIFTGKIAVVGSMVTGDTQVVPVKAQIDNTGGLLKPGMFAQLEVITDKKSTDILVIPNSAVVDANAKKIVYVQKSNDIYQPVEVTLGQTSGDLVEVKSGLDEGEMIVTQRAPQLYAQSLRGGNKQDEHDKNNSKEATKVKTSNLAVPQWLLVGLGGGAIATIAYLVGRRSKTQFSIIKESVNDLDDNHRVSQPESEITHQK